MKWHDNTEKPGLGECVFCVTHDNDFMLGLFKAGNQHNYDVPSVCRFDTPYYTEWQDVSCWVSMSELLMDANLWKQKEAK